MKTPTQDSKARSIPAPAKSAANVPTDPQALAAGMVAARSMLSKMEAEQWGDENNREPFHLDAKYRGGVDQQNAVLAGIETAMASADSLRGFATMLTHYLGIVVGGAVPDIGYLYSHIPTPDAQQAYQNYLADRGRA